MSSSPLPKNLAPWGMLICVVLLGQAHGRLVAQDDPFGGTPKKVPAIAPTDKARPTKSEDADLILQTLRDSKPATPERQVRAVKILMDLGRFEDAKNYLEQLIEAGLDDAVLTSLNAKFGSDLFVRLTTSQEVQPLGGQFGQAVLTAASNAAHDPKRIDSLITQLSDSQPQVRAHAAAQLRLMGNAAIVPLIHVLGDEGRSGEHPVVRHTLVRFGKDAVEPLIGALEASEPSIRSQVIQVLGQIDSTRALPYLLRPYFSGDASEEERSAAKRALTNIVGSLPTADDTAQYLLRRTRSLLGGEVPVPVGHDDNGQLWHWDSEQQLPEPRTYDLHQLSLVEAARMARELYLIMPDQVDHRRIFLATMLEANKVKNGLDQPLPRGAETPHAFASAAGADALEDVLSFCLKEKRPIAAVAVAEVLGDVGTPSLLVSPDGRPRPLAACLGHADRRLRFTAADAILKINPKEPYPGSSLLIDTLGNASASLGARRVLVALPKVADTQTLVGMLNEHGFQADAANSGRSAFQLAVQNPDYEFALLSQGLDSPRIYELVQMLRQDPRTAHLAVGILSRLDDLDQIRNTRELDELTLALARPYNDESLDLVAQLLLNRARRHLVPRDERVKQAQTALTWIGRLIENESDYSFYEVRRLQKAIELAIQMPDLATHAVAILGHLGSPSAQQLLVDVGSQSHRPIIVRQAAVDAFRDAVRQHSLLLTRDSILTQYQRYNTSETRDLDTQQVLSSILDVIERKAPPVESDAVDSTGPSP